MYLLFKINYLVATKYLLFLIRMLFVSLGKYSYIGPNSQSCLKNSNRDFSFPTTRILLVYYADLTLPIFFLRALIKYKIILVYPNIVREYSWVTLYYIEEYLKISLFLSVLVLHNVHKYQIRIAS